MEIMLVTGVYFWHMEVKAQLKWIRFKCCFIYVTSYSVWGMLPPLLIIIIKNCSYVLNTYDERHQMIHQMLVGYILSKVCLRCGELFLISIAFFISFAIYEYMGCTCSTDPFKCRLSIEYICKTWSSNRKHLSLSYFPWLCVLSGCTIIFCQLLHIHPRKAVFL